MVVTDEIHRLKVQELRDELTNRGLDSTGSKSELIDRLHDAMRTENDSAQNQKPVKTRFSDVENYTKPLAINTNSLDIGPEPTNWEQRTDVILDFYNCDLNLVIDQEGLTAHPFTFQGFSLMWAGCRANYGVKEKRVYFEVHNINNIEVDSNESDIGGCDNAIRIGWSSSESSLALGEDKFSYGYGGMAKKSVEGKFEDFGSKYGGGDIVSCYLEYDENSAKISYSVNGVDQGEAFVIEDLQGKPLYPHIYVKNMAYSVNFSGEPLTEITKESPNDWVLVGNLPVESRIRGPLPPASKKDCEVIMLIGLPGCGKTTYAEKLCSDNPQRAYNLLGTNLILENMKIIGLRRKRNYHGRWDYLIDKATKCLNTLIAAAASRRRNYILDQTNVYPSAQKRKMRPFEGYNKKAVVIVPTDEEYQSRMSSVKNEEGKDVPEMAINEMKKNFVIPKTLLEDSNSPFVEVEFPELNYEEANKLVLEYNQSGAEAIENAPPAEKKGRNDDRSLNDEMNESFRNNQMRNPAFRGRGPPFGGPRGYPNGRPFMRPFGGDRPPHPYGLRYPAPWHRPPYRMHPGGRMPHYMNGSRPPIAGEDETVPPVGGPFRPGLPMRGMPPRGGGPRNFAPGGGFYPPPRDPRAPFPPMEGDEDFEHNQPSETNEETDPSADPLNESDPAYPQQRQRHAGPPTPSRFPSNRPDYYSQSQSTNSQDEDNQKTPPAAAAAAPQYSGGFQQPLTGPYAPSSGLGIYANPYGNYQPQAPNRPPRNPHSNYYHNPSNHYQNNLHHPNTDHDSRTCDNDREESKSFNPFAPAHPSAHSQMSSVLAPGASSSIPLSAYGGNIGCINNDNSAASSDPCALQVAAYASYYASAGIPGVAAGKAAAGTSASETSLQAAIAAAASFNQQQIIKSSHQGPAVIGVQQSPYLQPGPHANYMTSHGQSHYPMHHSQHGHRGSHNHHHHHPQHPHMNPASAIPSQVAPQPKTGITTSGQPVNYFNP